MEWKMITKENREGENNVNKSLREIEREREECENRRGMRGGKEGKIQGCGCMDGKVRGCPARNGEKEGREKAFWHEGKEED